MIARTLLLLLAVITLAACFVARRLRTRRRCRPHAARTTPYGRSAHRRP